MDSGATSGIWSIVTNLFAAVGGGGLTRLWISRHRKEENIIDRRLDSVDRAGERQNALTLETLEAQERFRADLQREFSELMKAYREQAERLAQAIGEIAGLKQGLAECEEKHAEANGRIEHLESLLTVPKRKTSRKKKPA